MDDSFSLFAKSIRQKKINKNELFNNLKESNEAQIKKDQYIKKIIKIQKTIRGHLYRIKYNESLDEINTRTIIEYLNEKKRSRIHKHSIEIISFFITKYINKLRKNKKKNMLYEQYKIHCSDLIKARLRGVLVRKHIRERLYLEKNAKNKILKNILAYRTILILKSNTIQNLLVDIAKIKYQLKNLDKEKETLKIKELTNKLSKNCNLFYDTYYYNKDNCNWAMGKKTFDKWNKQYFDIINQKSQTDINKSKNKNIINSVNNGYQNYFLEFYDDSDDNNNINENIINQNCLTSANKKYTNNNSTMHSSIKNYSKKLYEYEFYTSKKNETCKYISEFKIEELKKEKEKKQDYSNVNIKKICKEKGKETINKIPDKNRRMSYKEDNRKFKRDINNIDLNNINNHLICSNKEINKFSKKDDVLKKSATNIYQQREDRPIKPLKNNNNILNCENPFGLRENSAFQKTTTNRQKNNFRNSVQYYSKQNINQYYYPHEQKIDIKGNVGYKPKDNNSLQYDDDDNNNNNNSNNGYGYGYNRINSEKLNNLNYNFINRDEKPVGGGKKIDYEAIFGEEGELHFEGDPFGGAKQFETNKNRIHCKSNTIVRKKPVYDARKAIEEAKLKEANECKKEKHTEFRDFLKEMKKISKEEKLKNNNNNIKVNINDKNNKDDINKKSYESFVYKKSYSESITVNEKEIINGNNIYKKDNYDEDDINNDNNDNKYIEYELKQKEKKKLNQREKSLNKSSNQILRKKLHDLEKAPAPVLNIKGAKSKIECWFDNNSNNNGNKYLEYSGNNNKPNGQNKLRKVLSCDYDQNYLINKKLENKIENYVEKKLSHLSLKIDEINDMFSIESYFEQKRIKMKKFVNIPYINENNIYVHDYTNDMYDGLIQDINKEYKDLK